MSRIHSSGNLRTEVALVQLFRENRITGWLRRFNLPGKPDLTFPREKVTIFIDGCFWHSCPKHGHIPKQNRRFWQLKLSANRRRDREINHLLRKRGWCVVRIWEHSLKKNGTAQIRRILNAMPNQASK
jgi:DNA mismatch endonuclease (patch repair protein)